MNKLIAHTRNELGEWHWLVDHLIKVAKKARKNTTYFRLETPAYWIGLWHDLGKANPAFQEYLYAADQGKSTKSVPHAFGGAALTYHLLVSQNLSDDWKDIALPIAGHHAGLHDVGILALKLEDYIKENKSLLLELVQYAQQLPSAGDWNPPQHTQHERELLIRMTFSALVDADYLDTESHFDLQRAVVRTGGPEISKLWQRFEANQNKLLAEAAVNTASNQELMATRKEIYDLCISAADAGPGFFRLTVPTGGGKTRSGLAFSLQHILANHTQIRRVIVAIPYTSIIDQTASEYRRILGHGAVLEHHSQVPISKSESQTEEQVRLRLASENWDAPVVVTTNVQLFESLFSNRPGKVRKLHNLTGSVIILDEVQTLPVGMLAPSLDILQALVKDYGVSVVLSSATQPAFHNISGISPIDIIPHTRFNEHFKKLARVDYVRKGKLTWAEIAAGIKAVTYKQVLVVLNSRKDALRLLEELENIDHVFHLSTLLCGWHRKAILRLVRRRLRQGLPVLLISTQVIEAGVDIDFPEVWRALGPLDRLVQAAGRCNRENKMPSNGCVVIFEPKEGRMPKGEYTTGFGLAEYLLSQNEPQKLHDPELHEDYFNRLYSDRDLDERNVQAYREVLNFPETAQRFRLIPKDTVSVVVEYAKGGKRLDAWRAHKTRNTWRGLQPYTISIHRWEVDSLREDGWLEPLSEGFYRWIGKYDRLKGLADTTYDPADLIL